MITITKISAKTAVQPQMLDSVEFYDSQHAYFLQEVIEGLQDGILILTETGELVHANASAYRIFSQLNKDSSNPIIPPAIWHLCESLLESQSLFPDQSIILSNEIMVDKSTIFRLRVRWLDLERFDRSCLLVTIENQYESVNNVALAEVKKYDLTPREAEIWCLYRAKYSYKEIGAKLYITVNTVKKHMKNIHAKRQTFLNSND